MFILVVVLRIEELCLVIYEGLEIPGLGGVVANSSGRDEVNRVPREAVAVLPAAIAVRQFVVYNRPWYSRYFRRRGAW